MTAGKVLVVHASEAMRALLTELLSREGHSVAVADSTFAGMVRFVDAPADLVILGLGRLDEAELDFVRTLKREAHAPRVLVTFPSPKRDLAVSALDAGADGYALEPFYGNEIVSVVRGQLAARERAEPPASLPNLAREVAHAILNPLQVITLLLQKSKVTKKELTSGIPGPITRIDAVVKFLKEYGAIREARPEPTELYPLVKKAADDAGFGLEGETGATANIDAQNFSAALDALCSAVASRHGQGAIEIAGRGEVRLRVRADVFLDEDIAELLDSVFVVRGDRDVVPGLALPRALLEGQGGSLSATQRGERIVLTATVPGSA